MAELTSELIREAAEFLEGRVRHTPVEHSPALSQLIGGDAWLKLEFLQITGSFKLRGALFRISKLTPEERRTGVATCSAGNHGKATAWAAREAGVRAVIYVPNSVDASKHKAMVALGAEVRVSAFAGYDDTEEWARGEAARDGIPFLSAFDDEYVMAGNGGSLALEVLQDLPDLRTFVIPVGGGGLGAGFAHVVKERHRGAWIIGCQHEQSPALALSLEQGAAVTRLPAVDTLAAGVEGGIGSRTFEILKNRIDQVALVSEAQIFEGVRWMLRHHQYLIEPTSAVTIAACLTGAVQGPAVVAVCGRNVSVESAARLLRV